MVVRKQKLLNTPQNKSKCNRNARRVAGIGNLVKGYNKMPKDCAGFQHSSGTFLPTLPVDDGRFETA